MALVLVPGIARPEEDALALGKTGAPPATVAAPIRLAVAAEGLQVGRAGSEFATFWLRRNPPAAALPPGGGSPVLAEGVALPTVPAATLLGVVRFIRPWLDYRNREIPAGIYTMRYALQPAMKEHKGVSRYRDFAILTPTALDLDLDRSPPESVAASIQAFGRGHPGVLAIFPFRDALAAPRVADNELGQPLLAVRVGTIAMGFVLQGHGKTDRPD